jgi:hypothetical protein
MAVLNMEYYIVIGIILIGLPLYIGQKLGQTIGVERVLDKITEDFQEQSGYFENLERQIKGNEVYLNSCIDFYDNHKGSMGDEEKTRHLREIRKYSEEINELKQRLANEKQNNQYEYEQEKIIIGAKREAIEEFIKTARFYSLFKDKTEKEILRKN